MTITVVNRRLGGKGVYVGRPSPLGNPFHLPRAEYDIEKDPHDILGAYRRWLLDRMSVRDSRQAEEMRRLREIALERPLALACWCAPKRCHADVIRDLLLSGEGC